MIAFHLPWNPMGSPIILKITGKYCDFRRFLTIFGDCRRFCLHFGPFLTSWRPGSLLKSFLEVVRFFWTDYGLVGMHGDPNRMYFHDFPYHLRSAGGPAGWWLTMMIRADYWWLVINDWWVTTDDCRLMWGDWWRITDCWLVGDDWWWIPTDDFWIYHWGNIVSACFHYLPPVPTNSH